LFYLQGFNGNDGLKGEVGRDGDKGDTGAPGLTIECLNRPQYLPAQKGDRGLDGLPGFAGAPGFPGLKVYLLWFF
jgi:collagen type IV alpha